ncbi:M12 family metallopeptidase [Sphingobacterium oryzagri]|uniref:M12 family metallopeptidase n=1 Tax=Sphingobacterium oryzagri TaxID=3025669 RepID=A0ABY7WCR0_9SPHI|nr:M12 family metallopeptidase [Sphingobacterium sp. KACC 22765]WDF67441.1 M12 family metallopeptidase [Sphingobacterium sp. KACC 22765]
MKKIFYLATLVLVSISCKQAIYEAAEDEHANYSSTSLAGDTTVHKLLINGEHTYINEIGGIYYFAEDLTITDEQFGKLLQLTNTSLNTTERATITTSLTSVWPNNTVYYSLPAQGSLNAATYQTFLQNIQNAFNLITAETSMQFVQRTNQPEYIQFFHSTGNNSPLGWSRNRVNRVNIYNWNSPAIIAHEVMHSMGIHHEQCRPDRNNYIIVDVTKAQSGTSINFNIAAGYAGNGTFDFNSVMMYSSTDFAINPSQPVMTRLDGSTFTKQRSYLSTGDYAGINALYPATN